MGIYLFHSGNKIESYIDLSGSLSTVSIALNGLLKMNGPLTQVRSSYHIDVAEDIQKSKDDEIKIMYLNFFQHIKYMNIQLMELGPYQTRMTYVIEKKTINALLIILLILDVLLSFIMGYGFSHISNDYGIQILVFCVTYVAFFVLFGLGPLMLAIAKTDNSIRKKLGTYFFERLESYISIVQKNQYWH